MEGADPAAPPTPREPDAVRAWLARGDAERRDVDFPALVARTVPSIRERIRTLSEYAPIAACFYYDGLPKLAADDLLPKNRTIDEVRAELVKVRTALHGLESWTAPAIEASLRGLAETSGWKVGDLFTPVRVAVTGSKISPPLFETIEILGRETVVDRLSSAAAHPDADS